MLLGWLFYNSKSSKPNRSASPFKWKNRILLFISSKLFIPPVQWPDLVLDRALVGILLPPTKMSSLELFPLMVVVLPHQPLLCYVLLLFTPPLKWPELVLAVAVNLQAIAVAPALSLSFPFVLTASSASHSRAPTNKHSSPHQKAIQTAFEASIESPNFGSSRVSRATF